MSMRDALTSGAAQEVAASPVQAELPRRMSQTR